MKHVFVINPAAGKENSYETIKAALEAMEPGVERDAPYQAQILKPHGGFNEE